MTFITNPVDSKMNIFFLFSIFWSSTNLAFSQFSTKLFKSKPILPKYYQADNFSSQFVALGQYYVNDDVIPTTVMIPIARKNKFLKEPIKFIKVRQNGVFVFWRLLCPPSFTSISAVVTSSNQAPQLNSFWCVATQVTKMVKIEKVPSDVIWKLKSTSSSFFFVFNNDDDVTTQYARCLKSFPNYNTTIQIIDPKPRSPRITSYDPKSPKNSKTKNVTISLSVVTSFIFIVGLTSYWMRRQRKASTAPPADHDSLSALNKTAMTSSAIRCDNINISYTGGPHDDDVMLDRMTSHRESKAAVVNPYLDASVESIPDFNNFHVH